MQTSNYLGCENVWTSKKIYEEAEEKYYADIAQASLTPLAVEVAKARQKLIESRDTFIEASRENTEYDGIKFFEKKSKEFDKILTEMLAKITALERRVVSIEDMCSQNKATQTSSDAQSIHEINVNATGKRSKTDENDDDDDVDLFGSDSDEENEAANKIREERLAAYNEKKSKKPVLIAKSNVILDIKPWDDETDMKEMERAVRKIETDGLLWGAAKLVPLAYGIHKLQISCVVEDDKVSIDWLQEQLESISDFVQSVDIAAFNKI